MDKQIILFALITFAMPTMIFPSVNCEINKSQTDNDSLLDNGRYPFEVLVVFTNGRSHRESIDMKSKRRLIAAVLHTYEKKNVAAIFVGYNPDDPLWLNIYLTKRLHISL